MGSFEITAPQDSPYLRTSCNNTSSAAWAVGTEARPRVLIRSPAMGDSARVPEALDRLRKAGGRVTHQRRLVLEALVDAQPHPSADDVAAHVGRLAPEIHLSTIYRTLNTLTDLGVISHVHLDHGRSVYHFSHDLLPHLVCRDCGRVDHVDAETFDAVRSLIEASTGFELDCGHFAWSARCGECRARNAN